MFENLNDKLERAFKVLKGQGQITEITVAETTKEIRSGWPVGGGIEFAETDNILAKAEYRYTDYGKYRYDSKTAFPGLTGEQQPTLNTVRLGVAYKF